MRRAATAGLLAAAIAFAGCGADEPTDTEQILDVIGYYEKATASHNAQLLCSQVLADRDPSLEACIDEISLRMNDPRSDLSRPDHLEPLSEPEIQGDRATLRVSNDGTPGRVVFVRRPSGWRLVIPGG